VTRAAPSSIALLSIHPRFARRILEGKKRVEFRKRGFGRAVTHVVVYATQPVGRVVGFFTVKRVSIATPRSLWADYCSVGGIGGDEFWRYYQGKSEGCAIEVADVWALERPIPLGDLGSMGAPQSFAYLSLRQFAVVRDAKHLPAA
tara:strand:- start:932 stop:1369 length:438 start_codon:yes stop_codon:yes gene_type:complete